MQKIWEIFALSIKTYQSDSSFTLVDGIEVDHQMECDINFNTIFAKIVVLGRGGLR
jgi:hypothetical protein